ncbi:hypothetical protein [Rhodoblastus sp.]|jgi:hypothetical protein|uniref:hypothetical protein n=1 Tax=Rhodoblastus sp. TaxID=1962975 RepID=UPI0025F6EED1|nr:hypothetical protein [Rhodoblastus sp.]
MKTEGLLQLRMNLLARNLAGVLLLFIGAVSVWTPLAHERVAERWFTWPNGLPPEKWSSMKYGFRTGRRTEGWQGRDTNRKRLSPSFVKSTC